MTIDKDSNAFKEFSSEFKTKLNSALLNKLTEIKKQIASTMVGENHVGNQKDIVESETNGIKHKKASASDRKKGESYSVVDTKNKKIIAQGIQRKSAKEIAETDDNFVSGSSDFIFDKYINTWN